MYIAVYGKAGSWNKPYPSLALGVSVMHCIFVNTMLNQHFEMALADVCVAEDEKLRILELKGSVLPSVELDGKELMPKYTWNGTGSCLLILFLSGNVSPTCPARFMLLQVSICPLDSIVMMDC